MLLCSCTCTDTLCQNVQLISLFCNTCLHPPTPTPHDTHPTGSFRSEHCCAPQPGFYGPSQRSRRDVWGPRHRRVDFLLIFIQLLLLLLFFLHSSIFKAS